MAIAEAINQMEKELNAQPPSSASYKWGNKIVAAVRRWSFAKKWSTHLTFKDIDDELSGLRPEKSAIKRVNSMRTVEGACVCVDVDGVD